jgi:hypothetical protein
MTIRQQGGVFGRNPSFNDVDANSVSATSISTNTISEKTSGNGVVIDGVTLKDNAVLAPFGVDVTQGRYKSAFFGNPVYMGGAGQMNFGVGGNDLILGTTNAPIRFGSTSTNAEWARLNASGNLIVPAGVTLGTTAGVYNAANNLDDYEEGTWTPAWSRLTAGDFAYSAGGGDLGLYTKIGNTVYASFRVQGTFTESTASGTYCITGLPFTKDANDYPIISIRSTSSGAVTNGSGQSGGTKVLFFGTPLSGENYIGALVYRV